MSVSDTLHDAVEDIREYLERYPDYYKHVQPGLDRLVKDMDDMRALIDTPPKP